MLKHHYFSTWMNVSGYTQRYNERNVHFSILSLLSTSLLNSTPVGSRAHSMLPVNGIFYEWNKALTMPRLVSFRGVIQNFQWASPTVSYGGHPGYNCWLASVWGNSLSPFLFNYCYSEISIAGGNVEHELKRSDEQSSHYECKWSTSGMSESKKKDRLYLVISVKFQDGKELNARVQCKMYSLKDKTHLMWGTCLKSLQIDCRVRAGQSHVDVQQVLFK